MAVTIALTMPCFSAMLTDYGDAAKFEWSEIEMSELIPEPRSHLGEITENDAMHLSICVYKFSSGNYQKYLNACKEYGFTIEAEEAASSYCAYNSDGYKLSLTYDKWKDKLQILMQAAKKYESFQWSGSEKASLVPVPRSSTGEIVQDDKTRFQVYVSDTSLEEYSDYVDSCIKNGFDVAPDRTEKTYTALNKEKYQITLSYEGYHVICITVDEPIYDVSIQVNCEENWIFSKYNVDVYLDDTSIGKVYHGDSETFTIQCTNGVYGIKFTKDGDKSVMGQVNIDIHQDEKLEYNISCTSSRINVVTIKGTTPELQNNEAKLPRSASSYIHSNYETAEKELSDAGFSNIAFEVLYDLKSGETGGEIDSIIIDGKDNFQKGDVYKKDASIIITYHMNKEGSPSKPTETQPNEPDLQEGSSTEMQSSESDTQEESSAETQPSESDTQEESSEEESVSNGNLTVDNCPELAAILSNKASYDESYTSFATKYKGRIIEFDGRIDYCAPHENYITRFDYLVSAGDYDPDSMTGPCFKFEDVNYFDLHTDLETVSIGSNVHIVAKVLRSDSASELFYLDPVSVTCR